MMIVIISTLLHVASRDDDFFLGAIARFRGDRRLFAAQMMG